MNIVNFFLHFQSKIKQRILDQRKYNLDVKSYVSLCDANEKFPYLKKNEVPILSEYRSCAGFLDPHYFLQDIFIAKKIINSKTKVHFDIGSRVDGFIAHLLASSINVNMIDIRPLGINVDGISFTCGDATDLGTIPDNSIKSLSSLHVIEHFGLGRYGDKCDPHAWIKGLKAMQRIVSPGGVLYISVPVGARNKLCFNAHRIFEIHEFVKILNQMKLYEFSYINDYEIKDVSMDEFDSFKLNVDYACGMYVFKKI